jgi:hypothetical protein
MYMFKAIVSNSHAHVNYYILDFFTRCDSFHHTNNCESFGQGQKVFYFIVFIDLITGFQSSCQELQQVPRSFDCPF